MKANQKHQKIGAAAVLFLASGIAFGGDVTTVRYSKEDLLKASNPQFKSATDLSDVLSLKMKLIFVTVTQRQAGSNVATRDLMASTPEMGKSAWMKKLSTLSVDPESTAARGDSDKLRVTLSQQTRKATEVKFKEAFPIFERIKNGLSFKLDLLDPSASVHGKAPTPSIRYGLVESDILPSERSVPVASLAQMSDIDSRYSSPAKVVYTIDRLNSEENKPVFQEPANESFAATQNTSVWHKAPSTDVAVKIDAADQNAAVSDQVGQGAMPGARITLTQADGFVTTQFLAGGKSTKDTVSTELKAPLYGEMSVSRKYDQKMKATQTAALNVLGNSALPRVNVLYAHNDKKVKGEWIVKKEGFEINVTAEPRQGYGTNAGNKLGKVGDKLSVGLNTNF